MLAEFHKLSARQENESDLNSALQVIWDSLPEETILKFITDFRKRLSACVKAMMDTSTMC